jgi:hypothetical protein
VHLLLVLVLLLQFELRLQPLLDLAEGWGLEAGCRGRRGQTRNNMTLMQVHAGAQEGSEYSRRPQQQVKHQASRCLFHVPAGHGCSIATGC